ncbi:MAG: DNA polymerase IV [Actinobacteria bacterium HGW-Actinobacteria-2]|nr:MAG: DNA polymerase IV [Actinobacteria bacterium HGW-Actinobacteria-2]
MAVIMHVDMDAFYAAVELRRHPELVDVPVWVGGERRGVVLSANYPARAFGVRGGMAVSVARRLCPHAVALRPDFADYTEASAGVRAILETITPRVEMASIDEAYLDLTTARRTQGTAVEIGQRARAMVWDEQRLSCSVGIGPNRLIAKMASVAAKPDGLVEIEPDHVVDFLHPLPVERLVGVGESTAARLHRLGVETIGDLAAVPRPTLRQTFGRHAGAMLAEIAWGRDGGRQHWARPGERGVGCQETFGRDLSDVAEVRAEILRVCDKVATRMRAAGVVGRTVTFHVRYADFGTRSVSVALAEPTDLTGELYEAALRLYGRLPPSRQCLRRVGVRVTGLVERTRVWRQPRLDDPEVGWDALESAADKVNRTFGSRAATRATLTGPHRGISI